MSGDRGDFDRDENDFLLKDWRLPKKNKGNNRRKGPDFWVHALTYFSIGGWALLLLAMLLLDVARPETETFFHRYLGGAPRKGWDENMKKIVFGLVAFCQVISVVGIGINSQRMRRKTDKYRWGIIGLCLAAACLGTLLFLFNK